MSHRQPALIALVLALAPLAACGGATDGTEDTLPEGDGTDDVIVDEEPPPAVEINTVDDVKSLMRAFATGGEVRHAFTKVNSAPFESEVDGHPVIEVYAPKMEASHYATIDPADTACATSAFSLSTVMIVKKPGVKNYLVSAKLDDNGADGWWYGAFTASGTPIVLEDQGASCRECHAHRLELERTDFLRGVPRAQLACTNPWLACPDTGL